MRARGRIELRRGMWLSGFADFGDAGASGAGSDRGLGVALAEWWLRRGAPVDAAEATEQLRGRGARAPW